MLRRHRVRRRQRWHLDDRTARGLRQCCVEHHEEGQLRHRHVKLASTGQVARGDVERHARWRLGRRVMMRPRIGQMLRETLQWLVEVDVAVDVLGTVGRRDGEDRRENDGLVAEAIIGRRKRRLQLEGLLLRVRGRVVCSGCERVDVNARRRHRGDILALAFDARREPRGGMEDDDHFDIAAVVQHHPIDGERTGTAVRWAHWVRSLLQKKEVDTLGCPTVITIASHYVLLTFKMDKDSLEVQAVAQSGFHNPLM